MYFKNSVGVVYIKGNTLVYEDSNGVVKMIPNDRKNLKVLYNFHVNQFKEIERMNDRIPDLTDLVNRPDF